MINNKFLIKKIKYTVILLICFLLFSFHLSWAADLPRLSQRKIRLSVLPGESAYGEIVVDNSNGEVISLHLYLEDWYYALSGDGSKEFAPANTTLRSCAPWIVFSPSELNIPPYGQQRVNYTVKVPAEAKGGYYAVLFFETGMGKMESVGEADQNVNLNLVFRIAALFYVEAKGTITRTGVFENFELAKEKDSGMLAIKMDFRNTGNVDITAGGTFHIIDSQGVVYSRGEFSDGYTLSGETTKMKAVLKQSLPRGKYDLILTLNMGKALKETNFGRLPVITKETTIEIDKKGDCIKALGLK